MKNQQALNRFVELKAEIDAALARLAALSDEHFEVSADDVNCCHVGTLASYANQLRQITDAAFGEGECA